MAASAFFVPGTLISVLLGVVMFGMGLATRLDDFKVVFSRPRDIAIGCVAQFTIMPVTAWALARLFGLDEALTVGVVLVGCCPGGTASNVMTYLAKGDLALSVGMTGVSTILAPFLTPALTWLLAGKTVNVNAVGMFVGILWVVILPICLGFAARRFCPKATERVVRFMPTVSSVVIAVIIALVVAANAERLAEGGMAVFLVVVLHNASGLALGYLLAAALRLAEPKRRALCIEVGMQNSGLAASLAATHFAAYPMAAVPGAIFSVWHNVSGALVARLFVFFLRADGLTAAGPFDTLSAVPATVSGDFSPLRASASSCGCSNLRTRAAGRGHGAGTRTNNKRKQENNAD